MTIYLLEIAGYGLVLFVAALMLDRRQFIPQRQKRTQMPLLQGELRRESDLGQPEAAGHARGAARFDKPAAKE